MSRLLCLLPLHRLCFAFALPLHCLCIAFAFPLSLLLSQTQTANGVCAATPLSVDPHSLMVMDMGQHVVQDYAQPLSLHQVMVPGLEDGALAFPPLCTARQLSPGSLTLHSCCKGHHPLA